MRTRVNPRFVALLLLAAAVAGGVFVFVVDRRADALLASGRDVSARLERLILTVGDVASSQQAYVAPGQPDQPWLTRSSALLRQLSDEATALPAALRSTEAGRGVDRINRGIRSLTAIDDKAQQEVQQAQSLVAADLIFSDGREAVSTLTTALRDLRTAEQSAALAAHSGEVRQRWIALAGVTAIWAVGLAWLVSAAMRRMAAPVEPAAPTLSEPKDSTEPTVAPIDLKAAADVCASLARISDPASFERLLASAAAVLDARGLVVWMGAGDRLFPALAHGYGDRFTGRLRPISRDADNATADAWRTGQTRTVAGNGVSLGAVAVPLSTVSGCVGVLAAELRHGREGDVATQAVALMMAAQLASVVSAWPAGTGAPSVDVDGAPPIAASSGV